MINLSKTQWTLCVMILIAVGNAIVPFLPVQIAAVITVLLGGLATIFHTSDVNSAVAQAKAPSEQTKTTTPAA